MTCRLEEQFSKRLSFIREMQDVRKGSYPEFPIDITKKASQQFCRDLALRGVEEMFEALGHLKNWKPHRETEVVDFNREEFLEEFVDGMNYFLSVLVLLGHDADDLFRVYEKKDKIIHERIKKGY